MNKHSATPAGDI